MSAKHFLTDPNKAVVDALKSLTLTNPSLVFDEANKIIYRNPSSIPASGSKISIVSGGGSGHEPGWVGYTGAGLLTAVVAGSIFASPSAEQVRACVAHRLPKDTKGVLFLVMNYTGDVLNFGMGAEKARAMGKKVETIVIGDDVGVGREKGGKVGRRGIAGAAVVVKVIGALAEMGGSLEDVARVGTLVGDNVVSVAASLSRVHVIGRPKEDAEEEAERLPHGTLELGMGIHNEPGCEKLDTDLPGTVKKMLAQLLDQSDKDRAFVDISKNDDVVMLINNFGGVSNLELGAITTEVWRQLTDNYGIKPKRVIAGVLNGSLNGLGFGVSLLKLVDTGLGPGKSILELIDAPAEAVGWPGAIKTATWEKEHHVPDQAVSQDDEEIKPSGIKVDPALFKKVLTSGLKRVIVAEPEVTKFDSIVGDGDCGTGLKRGAEAILQMLDKTPPTDDLLLAFHHVVHVVENAMDGTSGALYAIYLNMLAAYLRDDDQHTSTSVPISSQLWAEAMRKGLASMEKYTPAKPGDRTLMDALYPFVDVLESTGDAAEAAAAAKKGADGTSGMRASLGRSVYVGGDDWHHTPDPGAYGLSEFLTGVAEAL